MVLCPTTPLTRQWASAAAGLGVQLQPDARGPNPPRDFDGVAVTYARVASDPGGWAAKLAADTLVIVDEAHHLGEDLAWGESFQRAFAAARRWLLLSGTPFRSDATPIPGVRYDADGLVVPDVSYTYAEAVADGVCRPVAFVTFDGTLSWRSGDDVVESSFETVLSAREAARRYRTAISAELPEGLARIVREADAKLRAVRAAGHRDAAGLAVAADAAHARQLAKLLREVTGRAPVVVVHTDTNAARKLADFRASREPWIVAVNMVSEGVDVPRLRVGVYASAAKTALIFRQIVGRFVRTTPRMAAEPSWLYLPASRRCAGTRRRSKAELRHALRVVEPNEDLEAAATTRERAVTERRVRAAECRVRRTDDAVRRAAAGLICRVCGANVARRRGGGRLGARPSRWACRRSNAAQTCAANAAVWSRKSTAATAAAIARSTRGSIARLASSASIEQASTARALDRDAVEGVARAGRRAAPA